MTARRDGERRARAALSAAVEPPAEAIARHLIGHGPEATEAALRAATHSALDRTGRLHRRLQQVDGDEIIAAGRSAGARFVCPGDPEWPDALDTLLLAVDVAGDRWVAPPPGLWVRGKADLAELVARSVAVVGARAATSYGTQVAAELGADVSAREWTVVSGAAFGIDAAAHRGALAVGRPTIAVMACGVDVTYPRAHSTLLGRIVDDGLIVSELPPGTQPNRPRFLARNRLIAGMTCGTVVVEAATRSGALNTARWAIDAGRPVCAVPGPVTATTSGGCHALIRDAGATLVTDAAEVLDVVGELGVDAVGDQPTEERPLDRLAGAAADVYEALPARAVVTVDRLCRSTGLTVPECLSGLGELAVAGLVRRADGGWQRIPPTRRAGPGLGA